MESRIEACRGDGFRGEDVVKWEDYIAKLRSCHVRIKDKDDSLI
jgi:hypothetical protein